MRHLLAVAALLILTTYSAGCVSRARHRREVAKAEAHGRMSGYIACFKKFDAEGFNKGGRP